MTDKKILFITFDLSGYYNCILEELKGRYSTVDFYNLADFKFKYENIFQRIKSFYFKTFKKMKLKNYYKYQPLIEATKGTHYDDILIVRPDLFFDCQLEQLKKRSHRFIAYYHDSINNIQRKKDVIKFFDKVYSYEKRDVKDFDLIFLPNFIYLDGVDQNAPPIYDAFTIMSKDYRFDTLLNLAVFLKGKQKNYKFLVQSDKDLESDTITYITRRKNNSQVLEYLKKTKIMVDIHKYGVQDGLTFRTYESLYFGKKLITTNKDIKTYDFYNPNNIYVIEDTNNITIPDEFFATPYQDIPDTIYKKYHYKHWLTTILS